MTVLGLSPELSSTSQGICQGCPPEWGLSDNKTETCPPWIIVGNVHRVPHHLHVKALFVDFDGENNAFQQSSMICVPIEFFLL